MKEQFIYDEDGNKYILVGRKRKKKEPEPEVIEEDIDDYEDEEYYEEDNSGVLKMIGVSLIVMMVFDVVKNL